LYLFFRGPAKVIGSGARKIAKAAWRYVGAGKETKSSTDYADFTDKNEDENGN
jgi:hypothetical protein